MKRSEFEKRLRREINTATPSDFDALKKRCGIPEKERVKQTARQEAFATETVGVGTGAAGKIKRGRSASVFSAALAIVLGVAILFGVAVRAFDKGTNGSDPITGTTIAEGYFILDINPSVEIAYDTDGKVKTANGLNEDGDVLLYGMELVGKDYEAAAQAIFERCVKLGYFSAARTDNAMLVSATKEVGGKDEGMTEKIKAVFSDKFTAEKIPGVVITGVEDATLGAEAEKYGIDSQKYALILSYLALGGELGEDEYAEITVRELYAEISRLEREKKQENIDKIETDKAETEEELFRAASEAIAQVLEELEACIERLHEVQDEDDPMHAQHYERCLERLEEKLEQIETAKNNGECQRFVQDILHEIEEMGRGERDQKFKEMLDSAHAQIEDVFKNFENLTADLEKLHTSVGEKNDARLEKFDKPDDGGKIEPDVDIENWQEENEARFASSWYEYKQQWNEDRGKDLDD